MRKKHTSILVILTLLASVATSLTLTYAAPQVAEVTFRVEPNITGGVAVDGQVAVDVYIDAPRESAIIGWSIDVKVDPNVLEPGFLSPIPPPIGTWLVARSGVSGYFLYGWCVHNKYLNYTKFFKGDTYETAGVTNGTIETIVGWSDFEPGTGAGGTGKLATFFFTSKSETAYSPIEITKAFYYTSLNAPDPHKEEPDIIINGHYNEPLRVDIVKHSAFPEHHGFYLEGDEDGVMNLYAIVKNVGPGATYSKVKFELAQGGIPLYDVETWEQELAPGEMYGFKASARYYAEWEPGEGDLGIWYATARVYFDADGDIGTDDWTLSPDKPKTFKFTVKP